MRTIALIGYGAIARYVAQHIAKESGLALAAIIASPERDAQAVSGFEPGMAVAHAISELSCPPDLVLDCAGHGALRQHGAAVLAAGIDLITVSAGALADPELHAKLRSAAAGSGAHLRIASGAIGALDALSAASIGGLESVTYRGRKPPAGWLGSPAENQLDLTSLTSAALHFSGTARDAALTYPKNANVAASIAMAGIGFDDTRVELIADPGISDNIHEVSAEGAFGQLDFCIRGRALDDNPRSSALTAMSVVRRVLDLDSPIVI